MIRLRSSFLRCLLALFAAVLLITSPRVKASNVTELPKLLQPSLPLGDLAGRAGEGEVYRVQVPEGATRLKLSTSGGTGNCDLYVRPDAHPTTAKFFARSRSFSTMEEVVIDEPASGTWYILVYGESAYRDVRLKAAILLPKSAAAVPVLSPLPGIFSGPIEVRLKSSHATAVLRYTLDGSEPTADSPRYLGPLGITVNSTLKARAILPNGKTSAVVEGRYEIGTPEAVHTLVSGIPTPHRGGKARSRSLFRIAVPPGQKALRVLTGGGIGNSEVSVQYGAEPTGKSFRARNNGKGNAAALEIENPAAGDWYILLKARTDFSGAFVLSNVQSAAPDLTIWPARLKPYVSELESFSSEDCEVVEGMIAAGEHRLLRFTTETRNLGGADLVMGRPQDHPDLFEFQACHHHFHFKGFASYRLLDASGQAVAIGNKVSFCLEDVIPWDPTATAASRYDCADQGIQAGWADVYDSGLPGQWINITGVPAGTYLLEVTVNPDQILPESDYTNNAVTVEVTIPEGP
jgi:hypothetical protein